MPLAGLIDDKGKMVTWKAIEQGKGSFSDPVPFLMALYRERDKYCDFSVTELLNDPYYVQLSRRSMYFERPDDMADRLMGTAIHSLFEATPALADILREQQITATVRVGGEKVTVGGRFDYYSEDDEAMWDYKTVTMGKFKMMSRGSIDAAKDYERQINLYVFLFKRYMGKKVSKAYVKLLVRDWRYSEFRRHDKDPNRYPRAAILPVNVWPISQSEALFKDRVIRHVTAARLSDEALHEAGECDTWNGIRCEDYCPLSGVCAFRQQDSE